MRTLQPGGTGRKFRIPGWTVRTGSAYAVTCDDAFSGVLHRETGVSWHRTLPLAVLLGLPLLAAAAPSGPPGVETKSLGRLHDPVVVRTGLLPGATDRATGTYRLYAARDAKLEPIPFQFDQRGSDGELTLSEDGTDADFTFDDDDELVFMAKDTGDRAVGRAMPPGGDAALELEVTDPSRGTHGWAYLVHFPADPPPRSPIRYVTFDTAGQEARAVSYQVTYSHDPSNFLAGVRIPPTAGGLGEDLIGRVMLRINPTFSLLLTTWHAAFTEQSFSVVPDGVKNGPVRAVRRVRQFLDLGRAFPEIPNGKVYTYYYFSSFATPTIFSIPWLALKTLRDFRFESIDQFGVREGDTRYWDAANPEGVSFGGGERPVAADDDHEWWAVSGSRGTFLHALIIPQQWRAWGIRRGIVFRDGAGAPSDRAGDYGAGYSLLRMTNLRRAGAYEIDSVFVVMPRRYQPGDETEALAALRVPLRAEVRRAEFEDGLTRRASAAR